MTTNQAFTSTVILSDWIVRGPAGDETAVRLPHDAMLSAPRGPHAPGGADTAWFEGGDYVYRASWVAPSHRSGSSAALFFEGVQGDAAILVNDSLVGTVRSGYGETELPIDAHLRWGEVNAIEVRVANSRQPSERWYPGSGLYRSVSVVIRPVTHIARDGVRFRTRDLRADFATIAIDVDLRNAPDEAVISVQLSDATGEVATAKFAADDRHTDLRIPSPHAWSAEDPHLYLLTVRALVGDVVLDEHSSHVGIRTIQVDARRGLRINDIETLLRGACIHHDNGPLGAATHRAAEFRRIRLLKAAGFNAVRSAHHPMSRHLLDACDEIGMYVLDEFADYWFIRKSQFDHSDRFRVTWREDASAMIAKDRNRACVIMYAIGNEIPETALAEGVELAGEITDFFHREDPDRPVTVAINLFVNTLVTFGASPYAIVPSEDPSAAPANEAALAGSTEANAMVNHIGKMMHLVARLPRADRASRDAFAAVDIAGYNYGLARYRGDVRQYPERVILGTETLPGDVAWAWRLVRKHPAVIGDFVWAGWEYLGEAGVAVWVPGKRAGLSKPYPYIIAGPGMFDLTGRPDASLRLAQAAWNRLPTPVITVRPLDRSGLPFVRSAWRITDAVESWSWRGSEGKRAEIEIYSTDDEVELLLNGTSVGKRKVGTRHEHRVRFRVRYEPGTLVAIAYRKGHEVARSELTSASADVRLHATSESPTLVADGDDLAFIHIELADTSGNVEMLADELIEVSVSGPAELIGFATAEPATDQPFHTVARQTYRGRALAIVRSTGKAGEIRVRAHSQKSGTTEVEIQALRAGDADHSEESSTVVLLNQVASQDQAPAS